MSNKIYVVGRHKGEYPGLEVVGQESVNFPLTSDECLPVFRELHKKASALQAALVFQAMPAQMVAGIAHDLTALGPFTAYAVGAVVSVPGERPAGKRIQIEESAEALIKEVNPNARIVREDGGVFVVVDPPMPFVFSHIEWL